MRLIGLTGRSGSGKTTASEAAKELGYLVLDCDRVYAELTSQMTPCLRAIGETFGEDTVKDGKLYRPALREKVFSDPSAMEKLNALTARFVGEEIHVRTAASSAEYVLLDAPTLFQSGLDPLCDFIVAVVAPEEDCVSRIVSRDGISESEARRRLAHQPSAEFFREHCHGILENDGSREALYKKAIDTFSAIQKGAL